MKTYSEFWPYYLSEHSKPWTKRLHVVGTLAAIAYVIWCVSTGIARWAPLGLAIGYGFAWISHFFIEKNRPATWKYPWWSFISDFRMLFAYLTGRL